MTIRQRDAPVLIAGAGIAGLSAALAFAQRDFTVEVFEQATTLSAIGAGVQLSPNATSVLARLGVLPALRAQAVAPPAIVLRDAATLAVIARVALRDFAEHRWGSPYLVTHRADLQTALLDIVAASPLIRVTYGARIISHDSRDAQVRAIVEVGERRLSEAGKLLVGADGVWSGLRQEQSLFTGEVAWRRTFPATEDIARNIVPEQTVNAFLGPGFHLVAYPMRAGREVNLVAFITGPALARHWSAAADPSPLVARIANIAPLLRNLMRSPDDWEAYPVHTVRRTQAWTTPGLALIGDAAHAMTPFAAQGAAMAIEDGYTLAAAVAAADAHGDMKAALSGWEASRRARVDRVRKRGAFNKFAWHARGPVATARNAILKLRSPDSLADDMDWLYGYDAIQRR